VPGDDYLRSLLGKPHSSQCGWTQAGGRRAGTACWKIERTEGSVHHDLAVSKPTAAGIATGSSVTPTYQELGAYIILSGYRGQACDSLVQSLGTREDVHHFDIEVK
jgi:hypothetical protein